MEVSTNLGRVSLVPRGRYDGAAVYNRLDIVEYEGSSYLVLADGVTGVTPQAGAVYMLVAEKGDRGDTGAQGVQGETGNGITGIQRTAGSGAPGTRDTYTITYTDGSTDTFQVYNGADGIGVQGETGNGIASIQRTAGSGAPGTRDTYTITYTDGSTDTFQVYNGADGTGAGDMRAQTYDPTGKTQDVFAYADAAAAAKQDALLGQPGQVVVFNADGKPEAQDPPDTGVTSFNGRSGEVVPQEGDYTAQQVGALPITGGTVTGNVTVGGSSPTLYLGDGTGGPGLLFQSKFKEGLRLQADGSGVRLFATTKTADIDSAGSFSRLAGVDTPVQQFDAANKKYVDEHASAARRGVNLLDNWYFADTINQRGQTEYTSAGYTIDRWSIEAGAKLKVLEDGVVFTPNPSNYNTCTQYVENYKELVGKQLTLSVLIEENTCANCLLWFYGGNTDNFVCVTMNGSDKLYSVTMTPKSNITSLRCGFQGRNSAGSVKILAVKLELGDQQTLAHQDAAGNWVLNDPPPNKAQELLKCMRYQLVFNWTPENFAVGYGHTVSTTAANAFLPAPTLMRTTPTISNTDGNNWNCIVNGKSVKITSISVWFASKICIGIRLSGDFSMGSSYPLTINSSGANKVIFDANL